MWFSGCNKSTVDTLYSDADVTVTDCRQSPGSPGGGRQGFMLVGYGDLHRAEGRYRAYLRFELNDIDPVEITSAKLKLWKRREREDTLRVYAVADDTWDEYDTVWESAPPMGDRIASGYCGQGWNTIDVTEYLKAQVDNLASFGLRVEHDTVPGLGFNTRESGAPPMLIITHGGRPAGDEPADPGFPSSSELKHGVYIDDGSGNYKPCESITAAIEIIEPGQEIVLGPGVYYESFDLSPDGTPVAPLKIRGDGDPRPVIDGSLSVYWQPDAQKHVDRGLVYVTGDYWILEHLEVRNAHPWGEGRDNSTCIFVHDASHVTIRDCAVFFGGDGIFSTSSTDNITLEYNEVAYNAFPGAAYQHGHYICGKGTATVRFCHIHHNGGQNFKTRNEKCVFSYNYVHSPGNYQLDFVRARLDDQDAILIGNLVVTDNHPTNPTQMMVFGEDRHGGSLELYNNTFINYHPRNCCFVHMWFPEGVKVLGTTLTAANNLFYHNKSYGDQLFLRSEKPVPVSGENNWFVEGTVVSAGLEGTLFGADPGLVDPQGGDYRPAAGSPLVNAGTISAAGSPEYQYFHPMGRKEREIDGPAIDIGAFELGAEWQ
jgi:Right handed beta helix region